MSELTKIVFGVLSAEEIERMSVVKITKPFSRALSKKRENVDLRDGTPYDPRMGVVGRQKCGSCFKYPESCLGHFGHISLPFHCYNVIYINLVFKVLCCVCVHCFRCREQNNTLNLKIENNGNLRDEEYFNEVYTLCKKRTVCSWDDCPGGKNKLPTFSKMTKNSRSVIYMTTADGEKSELPAPKAYKILMKISDETVKCFRLGTHPKNFIFKNILVTSPVTRPYVVQGGEQNDDDTTEKYNALIKYCNEYHKFEKETGKKWMKYYETLETKIFYLLNIKENAKSKNTNGRRHNSINQRLTTSKTGHISSCIASKRTDQSARTPIIGGGIDLFGEEIGVPINIANTVTFPEEITKQNKQRILSFLKQKKIIRITPPNGKTIRVDNPRINFEIINDQIYLLFRGRKQIIEEGSIVHRTLCDGDSGILNRQPSLLKSNMFAGKIKIINDKAFRIPLFVTPGANADFDGDEMNMHFIQSDLGQAEVNTLFSIRNTIITEQKSGPVNGIVQDGLIGSYILTNTWADNTQVFIKKEIFKNLIFQSRISKSRFNNLLQNSRGMIVEYVKNENGNLEVLQSHHPKSCKVIKKKPYSKYIVEDENGNLDLIDSVPGKMFLSLIFPKSFTCYLKTNTNSGRPWVYIKNGVILPESGPICKKVVGAKNNSALHHICIEYGNKKGVKMLSLCQQLTDRYLPYHGFTIGVHDCMSLNPTEIKKKIKETVAKASKTAKNRFSSENKTLIELTSTTNVGDRLSNSGMMKNDKNALNIMRNSGAKGSVTNLTQIVGVVGQQIVDSGRPRLSQGKSLNYFDIKDSNSLIEARGFIENSYINGLNPDEAFFHSMAGREGVISTAIVTGRTGYIHKKIAKKMENLRTFNDGSVRTVGGVIVQFFYGNDGFSAKKIMFDPKHNHNLFFDGEILSSKLMSKKCLLCDDGEHDVRKLETREIDFLIEHIKPISSNPIEKKSLKKTHEKIKNSISNIDVCSCIVPKFLSEIRNKYLFARIENGESVGLIASSSIGEPTTQLVLNVFHNAGVRKVGGGMNRYEEILNATKPENQKNVSFTSSVSSKDEAFEIKNNLEKVLLEVLIEDLTKIPIYHQNKKSKFFGLLPMYQKKDLWWVGDCEKTDWIISLKFDKIKIYKQEITTHEIKNHIDNYISDLKENSENSENDEIHKGIKNVIASPLSLFEILIFVDPKKTQNHVKYCKSIYDEIIKIIIKGNGCVEEITPYSNDSGDWLIDTKLTKESSKIKLQDFYDVMFNIFSEFNVDYKKTKCSNIYHTASVLGIEAARQFMIDEIISVLSEDGTYVNQRHISLLIDSMVNSGEITSVSESGISRFEGPIAKMTFERPEKNFVVSSAFGEEDNIESLLSSVMTGTNAKIGPTNSKVIIE